MECADQHARAANQVSLFGGDDSDMVAPPEYVKAAPWTDKQRLSEEKIALGFYLSGHLFDSYAPEARRFARTKLSDLKPSRETSMMAGVISGIRTQMTQRGKIIIVSLDDKSAIVEVTVYGELFESNKRMFKEDEFLAVIGKVSEDRFTGGLRITAEKAFDIVAARLQYGRQLGLVLSTGLDPKRVRDVLAPHCTEAGLPITARMTPQGVPCAMQFGPAWRVAPSDELQLALEQQLGALEVQVEY